MKYSIIIPVYNQLNYTKQCLQSVIKMTKNLNDCELIIVCNGCTDKTEEWVLYFQRTYKANIVLCSYEKPLGFGGATNGGISLSCGEYLILLNNDCKVLSSNWIEELEKPFVGEPRMGITGPLLYWSDITRANALIFFCVMIHRKVINKIGFLDNITFPIGAGEDTDYCARAQKAGFLIAQVPEIPGTLAIYHVGEATLNTIPNWNEKLYWEHREALEKKYMEK